MIDPQTITEAKRALGRQLAALREAAGKTQHQLAQQISYGRSTIANAETGYSTCRRTFWEHADKALHAGGALLAGYDELQALTRHHHIQTAHVIEQRRTAAASFPSAVLSEDRRAAAERWGRPGQHDVELLRQDLDDVLVEGTMAQASLDDWERTVARYGRASRDRSASALLQDLSIDLVDLKRALRRHRSASALRRLTRVTAHMSGLMCLTLCKLDNRPAFRRWARTARLAATEAGDPATHSWILAQESYGHYYSGNLVEAVEVALRSQEMVSSSPCVGAALAAALEARRTPLCITTRRPVPRLAVPSKSCLGLMVTPCRRRLSAITRPSFASTRAMPSPTSATRDRRLWPRTARCGSALRETTPTGQ